jgi:hypothetical protein
VSASAGARSEGLGDALCENQLSEAVCMSSAFITSMESLTYRHSPLQCKLDEEICVDRAIVRYFEHPRHWHVARLDQYNMEVADCHSFNASLPSGAFLSASIIESPSRSTCVVFGHTLLLESYPQEQPYRFKVRLVHMCEPRYLFRAVRPPAGFASNAPAVVDCMRPACRCVALPSSQRCGSAHYCG